MQNFYTKVTNYTHVPKANEQLKTCALLHFFLSEVLSSAKRILRVTDLKKEKKNISYIKSKVQYPSYDQTTKLHIYIHFLGKISCQSSYLRT